MEIQELECGDMEWIDLAQDRGRCRALVNAVMDIRVPQYADNFLTSREPVGFSRRTLPHAVSKLSKSLTSLNYIHHSVPLYGLTQ
jgi:hypothetical protein